MLFEREEQQNTGKADILSMTLPELQAFMAAAGEKSFRAKQVFGWLHVQKVRSFQEMANLPKSLRDKLEETAFLPSVVIAERQVSALDGTRKIAFGLSDGAVIESVFMPYHHGNSVCISSQVGCRMGCAFCASTLNGLARNLLPSEMLSQVYEMQRDAGERVSHVVVMGTGEPLDNLENLVRFLRLLSDEEAGGISQRNITVSTCGLVPRMEELAREQLQITLALSLHAPNDELRRRLMPVASRYSIRECLQACDDYFAATGRRISYEYALIRGVNDGPEQAEELAGLLHGRNCHVNLIPVNPVRERDFREPLPERAADFKFRLEKRGINVTIRRRMGADIDSACGQLRRKQMIMQGEKGGVR